ncbi:MAG: hypothetical protein QXO69_00655 [archaeon]
MLKGLVITGIALLICLMLAAALAYTIHSHKITDSSVIDRMAIDRTNNRAADIFRIIDAAASDAKSDAGCSEIDARLTSVLDSAKAMLSSEGITMTYTKSVVSCSVSVNYTLDSLVLHKQVTFSKAY